MLPYVDNYNTLGTHNPRQRPSPPPHLPSHGTASSQTWGARLSHLPSLILAMKGLAGRAPNGARASGSWIGQLAGVHSVKPFKMAGSPPALQQVSLPLSQAYAIAKGAEPFKLERSAVTVSGPADVRSSEIHVVSAQYGSPVGPCPPSLSNERRELLLLSAPPSSRVKRRQPSAAQNRDSRPREGRRRPPRLRSCSVAA